MTARVRMSREPRGSMHAFGTITWRVYHGDRWVGWVGDARDWKGWRYGGTYWWAAWREDADTAVRVDIDHLATRADALNWLINEVTRPVTNFPDPDRKETDLADE